MYNATLNMFEYRKNVEVYQTTSSPFKVSNMENSLNRSEIIEKNMNFASTSAITQGILLLIWHLKLN